MTLMYEKVGQGNARRCDAKCYNARHPDCDCICGGKNHGAGLQQAAENTSRLAEAILEKYSEMEKPEGAELKFSWNRIRLLLSAGLPFPEAAAQNRETETV